MPSNKHNNNLLRKLASSHYQSYTTALTVTIAVGCFLLLLNILIFAGIYHQRDKSKCKKKKKKDMAETGSCSSSSAEAYENKSSFDPHQSNYEYKHPYKLSQGNTFECKTMSNFIGEYSCEKRGFPEEQMPELALQQFKSSPPPAGGKRVDIIHDTYHPPDVTTTNQQHQDIINSPSIPEPPPPPKNQPPAPLCVGNQSGILRSHPGPTTPGTMKKRVQIQEISV